MPQTAKTKVSTSGLSQQVAIPPEFRLTTDEVYIRRDEQTGDLILTQPPANWAEFFASIAADPFPEDFLADRDQGTFEKREDL